MARPAKSVKTKSGAISKSDNDTRNGIEEKLRGASVLPTPPDHLTPDQRGVFDFIVSELKEADVLGRLDVYVLESTAVAISRVRQINTMVDEDPLLLQNTALQASRAKYQADIWRGANELCLSPQARAKIGSLATQSTKKQEDPLLKVLSADD